MWILRTAMLLALIVWIGGIIFFALVLAPALFTVLPAQLAANVVSPSLTRLHWIGLFAGVIFLACSLGYNQARHSRPRLLGATHFLVVIMLILTAISQFAITPRMRELRSGPGSMDTIAARRDFDRLHSWSTRTEAGVLLLGLLVVIVMARQMESV
jgi:uncharacterized membrane protein